MPPHIKSESRGAVNSRLVTELTDNDTHRSRCYRESLSRDHLSTRRNNHFPKSGNTTANDNHLRVKNINDINHANTEIIRRSSDNILRQLIKALCSFAYHLCSNSIKISLRHSNKNRFFAAAQSTDSVILNSRTRGKYFQAADIATTPPGAMSFNSHMPEFSGSTTRTEI